MREGGGEGGKGFFPEPNRSTKANCTELPISSPAKNLRFRSEGREPRTDQGLRTEHRNDGPLAPARPRSGPPEKRTGAHECNIKSATVQQPKSRPTSTLTSTRCGGHGDRFGRRIFQHDHQTRSMDGDGRRGPVPLPNGLGSHPKLGAVFSVHSRS